MVKGVDYVGWKKYDYFSMKSNNIETDYSKAADKRTSWIFLSSNSAMAINELVSSPLCFFQTKLFPMTGLCHVSRCAPLILSADSSRGRAGFGDKIKSINPLSAIRFLVIRVMTAIWDCIKGISRDGWT